MLERMRPAQDERHGLAAGAAPERADWTIDQGWDKHTAEDHGVWKTLFERQTRPMPGRATPSFVRGMRELPIGADGIPDFRRLSDVGMKRMGWPVVAVPGWVPDDGSFYHLADRRFPCGQFIRRPDPLDDLEEPEGSRIHGSGIASSATRSVFSLEDFLPNRLRFDVERVMRTRYRMDDLQETCFVIETLDELLELARIDFTPLYERAQGQGDHEPGTVLATARIVSRGTGRHHDAKRQGVPA